MIIVTSFSLYLYKLYSNISHKLGLKVIEQWIDKFPDPFHDRFSKPYILSSLKFILEHSVMNFDWITY